MVPLDNHYRPNHKVDWRAMIASVKRKVKAWLKFNAYTFPIIALCYIPYQIIVVGLDPVQIARWALTSSLMSAGFNLIYQPYVSWLYRSGRVK